MSITGIASTALNSVLNATPTSQNSHGKFQQIQREFQQLGQDLQSGNLTQAQQDFQQQQQQQGTNQVHHHHHHGGGQQSNQISQALNSLSAALQSNNLSSAQTAFATLQQDLQQFESPSSSANGGTTTTPSHATAGSLNVTA
ncbi:MAG: hypothetical protein WAN72_26450 [Candidatus Acidiferrales bacterium]